MAWGEGGGGQQFSGGQPQFYAASLCSVRGLQIVLFPPALAAEVLLLLDERTLLVQPQLWGSSLRPPLGGEDLVP